MLNLVCGDCREIMKTMADASADSCVTDPPYELGFMGKAWDKAGVAFDPATWREVLRVLKPGGHLLAFGGTRTYHRMACAIEDAGFEVRDSLHWIYGTGFPKSLNVGGGRGTALKPAHEPIILARKPLVGTVAQNILAHGTGALNIDASRIKTEGECITAGLSNPANRSGVVGSDLGFSKGTVEKMQAAQRASIERANALGRFPANVLFAHLPDCTDEECAPGCAVAELDRQSKPSKSTGGKTGRLGYHGADGSNPGSTAGGFGDFGGASRFFYVAKPSRSERDAGCGHLPKRTEGEDGSAGTQSPGAGAGRTGGARNIHPTVKPVDLMRYLVRLVTPPGGLVLDPFMGSGTTGMAAVAEGLRFAGIEQSGEYLTIARARIQSVGGISDLL